jgi:hypothetical protein
MSKNTKQVNVIVVSLGVIILSLIWNKTKKLLKMWNQEYSSWHEQMISQISPTMQSAMWETGSYRKRRNYCHSSRNNYILHITSEAFIVARVDKKSCRAIGHVSWLKWPTFMGLSVPTISIWHNTGSKLTHTTTHSPWYMDGMIWIQCHIRSWSWGQLSLKRNAGHF